MGSWVDPQEVSSSLVPKRGSTQDICPSPWSQLLPPRICIPGTETATHSTPAEAHSFSLRDAPAEAGLAAVAKEDWEAGVSQPRHHLREHLYPLLSPRPTLRLNSYSVVSR